MKVFSFSGKLTYNYGDVVKIQGFFTKGEGKEMKGYMQEERGDNKTTSAIKGLYEETTANMLFVKTSLPGGYKPELYIFDESFEDGWVSSYNNDLRAFFVYGGVRTGKAELASFEKPFNTEEKSEETYAQSIENEYLKSYLASTPLSKELVDDVFKYEWLFSFVKHLRRSAK